MVRKILALVLCGLLFFGYVYAASYKSNASPVIVALTNRSTTSLYKNITFSYPTKDLIVRNNSGRYIYVDVHNDDNTTDTAKCFLLAPGQPLELYDYVTNGISLIYASPPMVTASDISILSVY